MIRPDLEAPPYYFSIKTRYNGVLYNAGQAFPAVASPDDIVKYHLCREYSHAVHNALSGEIYRRRPPHPALTSGLSRGLVIRLWRALPGSELIPRGIQLDEVKVVSNRKEFEPTRIYYSEMNKKLPVGQFYTLEYVSRSFD